MLKFGISEEGYSRLAQVAWTDSEEFLRGEVVLAAMGYDVDSMSDDEKADILNDNPNYLDLEPQFDVEGQWIHSLRETHLGSISYEIEDLISSDKEICVTSAQGGSYWNIEFMRRFAVVFDGICRVLWNADVYSYFDEQKGQLLKDLNKGVAFIGEVTEGWLLPSASKPVGILVNWEGLQQDYGDLQRVQPKLQDIASQLGLPLLEDLNSESVLVDVEIIPSGESTEKVCEL